MSKLETYISSGVLELYAAGALSLVERQEVERMSASHQEVAEHLKGLQNAMEAYATLHSKKAPKRSRDRFMATLDQLQSEDHKANKSIPAILNSGSKPGDYAQWLENKEYQPPTDFDNIFFIKIADNEDGETAIVWIKKESPEEVHEREIEKFLILEGECIIEMQGKTHSLKPGDFLSIPLHVPHTVKVTSDIPVKILLQRIAA